MSSLWEQSPCNILSTDTVFYKYSPTTVDPVLECGICGWGTPTRLWVKINPKLLELCESWALLVLSSNLQKNKKKCFPRIASCLQPGGRNLPPRNPTLLCLTLPPTELSWNCSCCRQSCPEPAVWRTGEDLPVGGQASPLQMERTGHGASQIGLCREPHPWEDSLRFLSVRVLSWQCRRLWFDYYAHTPVSDYCTLPCKYIYTLWFN